MKREMRYSLYVPPDWKQGERLPLIVFLHGGGDDPSSIEHLMSERARAGQGLPRAVIISPNGDLGFWENWASGERAYRDWVVHELVPFVQNRFGTLPCPAGCHVLGVSMGGYGVLSFILHEPGKFASAAALSAPIYEKQAAHEKLNSGLWKLFIPGDEIWGPFDPQDRGKNDPYTQLESAADLGGTRLLIGCGFEDHDDIRRTNVQFERYLQQRNIPHERMDFPGDHSWQSWAAAMPRVLAWQVSTAPAASREDLAALRYEP